MSKSKQRKIVRLHAQQGGKCYFCNCDTHLLESTQNKMTPITATIEHLIPKSKGGTNAPSNLKMSCHQCNSLRGNMHAVEWLQIAKDPQKVADFIKQRELTSLIRKFKQKKKFKQWMLKRTGMFYTHVTVPRHVFDHLFNL